MSYPLITFVQPCYLITTFLLFIFSVTESAWLEWLTLRRILRIIILWNMIATNVYVPLFLLFSHNNNNMDSFNLGYNFESLFQFFEWPVWLLLNIVGTVSFFALYSFNSLNGKDNMRNWLLRFKLNAVNMYRHMKSSQ